MWVFSKYGFYALSCAREGNGKTGNKPDLNRVMIRARLRDHVENLQNRFPELKEYEILDNQTVDYRYRLIVPKALSTKVFAELSEEMDYDKFKPAITKWHEENNRELNQYDRFTLDTWHVMFGLQFQEEDYRPDVFYAKVNQ